MKTNATATISLPAIPLLRRNTNRHHGNVIGMMRTYDPWPAPVWKIPTKNSTPNAIGKNTANQGPFDRLCFCFKPSLPGRQNRL